MLTSQRCGGYYKNDEGSYEGSLCALKVLRMNALYSAFVLCRHGEINTKYCTNPPVQILADVSSLGNMVLKKLIMFRNLWVCQNNKCS